MRKEPPSRRCRPGVCAHMKQIIADSLTKIYPLKGRAPANAGGPFGRWKKQSKTALDRVSFSAAPGEAVGIIGRNGSGKSTLLKLISGVTAPTAGKLLVRGRLAALLELGAGFHPEYTGIQNIYLNGTLCGMTRAETTAKLPEILDFADIGSYAHQPVKTYSDGMFVRLAFAAAACTAPDILLVDEALSVGDFLFQAKCFRKFETLKRQGVTILYVTHDIDTVRKFCTRAIWLDQGRVRQDGAVGAVTSAYMEDAVAGGRSAPVLAGMLNRFGSHTGAIRAVSCPGFWRWGEEIAVHVTAAVPQEADPSGLSLSLAVRTREGLDLLVLSTAAGGVRLEPGQTQTVTFRFQSLFCPGRYSLAAGLERRDTTPITYYDYCEGIAWAEAGAAHPQFGLFHIPAEVEVHGETES